MTAGANANACVRVDAFPLSYNPSLGGLRALAVAAVVLFHCKAPGFGWGHLGVDIFSSSAAT
jgi:peptidoglycan/LPS O-acetylase OafA/YrhL